MSDKLVRIRMKEAADGLDEGTEWDAYVDGGGWFAVDETQGEGAVRNWRCVMPSEAVVVSSDDMRTTHDADYGPDGYPLPRPSAAMRRWWPDAEAADPPED